MKILGLSLDSSILDKNSPQARRVIEYGQLVERFIFITMGEDDRVVDLSKQVRVYGVKKGNKISTLWRIFRLAKKILNQKDFNIISVQDVYYLALVGLILAWRFKIGLELQVHGFEKFFGLRRLVARFLIPRADSIRTVSQRLKKQLIKDFGAQPDKITIVPIFIDGAEAGQQKEIPGLKKRFIFLTVGRLVKVKNIGLQIRALAVIIEQHPEVELWIVGDGPQRLNLESEVQKLGLAEKVKFWGWQEDLAKFYQQADAFVLTSDYEGWGLAVVGAAASGLPIIMTDVGCAGELIKDGQSGIVIPISDQSKLEEAMRQLVENRGLREKLGQAARQAIKNLPSKQETLALIKKSWERAIKWKKSS